MNMLESSINIMLKLIWKNVTLWQFVEAYFFNKINTYMLN